jgi:hypothetical protein
VARRIQDGEERSGRFKYLKRAAETMARLSSIIYMSHAFIGGEDCVEFGNPDSNSDFRI